MTVHSHIAVVGRVDGNDEDDVFLYENLTLDQARSCFREDLREAVYDATRVEVAETEVYINHILTSASPIVIEERNV